MEHGWGPLSDLDLLIDSHCVAFVLTRCSTSCEIGLDRHLRTLIDLLRLLHNSVLWQLFQLRIVWMTASLWICLPVRLLIEAFVHEVRHLFVREIVHHLDLDLLKNQVPLLSAFMLGLLLEANLRCLSHVDLSDLFVVSLYDYQATVSGARTSLVDLISIKGCNALQDDIDKLNIE